jgi:hypothetical protein
MKVTIYQYNIDYYCLKCGDQLLCKSSLLLKHRGTPKKNKCPHAGKTFRRPVVELEEVK